MVNCTRCLQGFTTSAELKVTSTATGLWYAACTGQFPSGDLLVSLTDGAAPAQVTVLSLDAPPPQVRVNEPPDLNLHLAQDGSELLAEELRWTLDFAPLSPQTTTFLQPIFTPAAPGCGRSLYV